MEPTRCYDCKIMIDRDQESAKWCCGHWRCWRCWNNHLNDQMIAKGG